MTKQFEVTWIDRHREPKNRPNPAFPDGVHLDLTEEAKRSNYAWLTSPSPDRPNTCLVELEYPAKRCGAYTVRCLLCGLTIMLTTAGRVDDPRSVRMGCKMLETKQ